MQGRVRTKTVKRASRILIEKYYQKLTMDFDTNKRICDEVADIQTKRLRNKIAGFTTVRTCQRTSTSLFDRFVGPQVAPGRSDYRLQQGAT